MEKLFAQYMVQSIWTSTYKEKDEDKNCIKEPFDSVQRFCEWYSYHEMLWHFPFKCECSYMHHVSIPQVHSFGAFCEHQLGKDKNLTI